MKSDIVTFVGLQRRIFGVCPQCQDFFRLSDTKVFLRKRPESDWMDRLASENERLDNLEARLDDKLAGLRHAARERGRCAAQSRIRKIDRVFSPLKLNPDDAKVLFHPIDYVVFKGMNGSTGLQCITLLDRVEKSREHRALQRSIEKAVEKGHYSWTTLTIQDDGKIKAD